MMDSLFLPNAYIYMNAFVLAFGAFAIVTQDGSEALLMVRREVSSNFSATWLKPTEVKIVCLQTK
jgi:hypothetical protein